MLHYDYPLEGINAHHRHLSSCVLLHAQRIVFLATAFLYAAFQLQGALSRNVATLLSCRLLTGIFGASRTFQLAHLLILFSRPSVSLYMAPPLHLVRLQIC